MKLLALTGGLFLSVMSIHAQDEKDTTSMSNQLDLYAVLSLFEESESLEDFEKKLNTESNGINNVDLNNDDDVDYIRVVDHIDGDAHAITLRVPVEENEEQDIAVIELEKTGEDQAQVQVVGDEDFYGADYYVEPKNDASTEHLIAPAVIVNVWGWPTVRFVFAPGYKRYVSPWRWRKYPRWWKPWRPVAITVYRPRVAPYRARFHRVRVHRTVRAHAIYRRNRVVSRRVHRRAAVRQHPRKRRRNAPTKRGRGRRR